MAVQVTPAQAAALAASSQQSLKESPQPVQQEVHSKPTQGAVQTTGMENRLHHLEEELEDVQRKTRTLKDQRARKSGTAPVVQAPPAANRRLLLTQVDGRGGYVEAATQPQPSQLHNNLEAVRRATRAAGNAADKLRHTAEKEFAEAAQRRVRKAISTAHDRVKSIPGYQVLGAPGLPPVPTHEPTPVQSLTMNFGRPTPAHPAHAAASHTPVKPAARDMDNEDSPDSEEDPADKEFADIPGAHSLMVYNQAPPAPASAVAVAPPKCESDCVVMECA
jgi:hypothetical protein